MYRTAKLFAASIICVMALSIQASAAPESRTFKLTYSYVAHGYSTSQRFSKPSGLFYDTNRDELYVADTGNNQIVIFDKKGMPTARIRHNVEVASSTDRKSLPGEPKSILVRKNGDILVTDNLCNYVDVLDFRGRSLEKIWPADLLGLSRTKVQPRCLAIDAAQNIYVSVTGAASSILVFTPEFKLKSEIGRIIGGGTMKSVTGLWVDNSGKVYATYSQGECVRVYAADGKQLTSFGGHDVGYENFSLPVGVVTDAQSNIWVVDTLRHIVSAFKQETTDSGLTATVIHALGGYGSGAGEMSFPTALAGDGSSKLFILEGAGARLQAFSIDFAAPAQQAGVKT